MTLVGTSLSGLCTLFPCQAPKDFPILILTYLASIRAYGAQDAFSTELKEKIDLLSRSSYCFYDINRWVSIRMDALGAIFSGVIASYLIFSGNLEAGFAGFTLSVVLSFSRLILYWMRFYNLLEIQGMCTLHLYPT